MKFQSLTVRRTVLLTINEVYVSAYKDIDTNSARLNRDGASI